MTKSLIAVTWLCADGTTLTFTGSPTFSGSPDDGPMRSMTGGEPVWIGVDLASGPDMTADAPANPAGKPA
jgi:hypothetical protein